MVVVLAAVVVEEVVAAGTMPLVVEVGDPGGTTGLVFEDVGAKVVLGDVEIVPSVLAVEEADVELVLIEVLVDIELVLSIELVVAVVLVNVLALTVAVTVWYAVTI